MDNIKVLMEIQSQTLEALCEISRQMFINFQEFEKLVLKEMEGKNE